MRRAERLFQILQILRRSSKPVTAKAIAEELELSLRSVYRDMAALIGQRVPIRGEAGVGYVLEAGFDLPPLMLNLEEVEAAMLGAQWVAGYGDPSLATAARDLIAKIRAVLPSEVGRALDNPVVRTPPAWRDAPDGVDAAALRLAIRSGSKLQLLYRDNHGAETSRTVWPALLAYQEQSRILVAWCELRNAFRSFRLDRLLEAMTLAQPCAVHPTILQARWLAEICSARAVVDQQAKT